MPKIFGGSPDFMTWASGGCPVFFSLICTLILILILILILSSPYHYPFSIPDLHPSSNPKNYLHPDPKPNPQSIGLANLFFFNLDWRIAKLHWSLKNLWTTEKSPIYLAWLISRATLEILCCRIVPLWVPPEYSQSFCSLPPLAAEKPQSSSTNKLFMASHANNDAYKLMHKSQTRCIQVI